MRWLLFIIPATLLIFAILTGSSGGIFYATAASVLTFPPLWARLKLEGRETYAKTRGTVAFFAAILAPTMSMKTLEADLVQAMLEMNAQTAVSSDVTPEFIPEASKIDPVETKQSDKGLSTPEPNRIGSSIYEQAIFDAFPSSRPTSKKLKLKASQASDFIGATINSQGHLCARPVGAQKASDGLYGIGCVTSRSGTGQSFYLLNTRSGEVTAI